MSRILGHPRSRVACATLEGGHAWPHLDRVAPISTTLLMLCMPDDCTKFAATSCRRKARMEAAVEVSSNSNTSIKLLRASEQDSCSAQRPHMLPTHCAGMTLCPLSDGRASRAACIQKRHFSEVSVVPPCPALTCLLVETSACAPSSLVSMLRMSFWNLLSEACRAPVCLVGACLEALHRATAGTAHSCRQRQDQAAAPALTAPA